MVALVGSNADDTLVGSDGNDSIYGGNGNDLLIGGDGSDSLEGGFGNDTLVGGAGDDFYIVGEYDEDLIFENLDGGYDTVRSASSIQLAANLEALELLGTDGIWGQGNELDNKITGNSANNELQGDGGDDTIDGGAGWDVAYYNGNFEDYDFSLLPDGSLRVTHRNGGSDGMDTLISVESVSFANNYFDVSTLSMFVADNSGTVGVADSSTIDENGTAILDVLANDYDNDWTPGVLHISDTSITSGQGSISIENERIVYAAGSAYDHLSVGETATIEIAYTVSDQYGGLSTATATITLVGSNDGPVVHDKSYQVAAGTPLSGNVFADTGNGADSDPDGDTLIATAGTYSTSHGGSVTISASGDFVYAPAVGYTGADSFTYSVGDGQGGYATGYVDLSLLTGADGPVLSASVDPSQGTQFALGERLANGITAGAQNDNAVGALADGGYVVAWSTNVEPTAGVWFQRYSATGVAVGDPVHASPQFPGGRPDIIGREDGGFTVAWSGGLGIFGHSYDAAGVPLGAEFQINQYFGFPDKILPSVAQLEDGSLIATWTSGGIVCRQFSADGTPLGNEFVVSGGGEFLGLPGASTVTELPDGGYFVTWVGGSPTTFSAEIFGQRFDSSNVPMGGVVQLNAIETGYGANQYEPSITTLADGTLVATWRDALGDGNDWGISGRRFDVSGNALGGTFTVNTHTLSMQMAPTIASLEGGGFVVAWHSINQDDSGPGSSGFPGFGVYAQCFDATGAKVGPEIPVNTYVMSDQITPHVAGLATGGFVVSWDSFGQDAPGEWGVYSQQFDANGERLSPPDFYTGMPVPLDISAAPVDTDGSETLSILIGGLPAGAALSAGTVDAGGIWTLTANELAGLEFVPPPGYAGSVHLTVSAIATEISNGDQATTTQQLSFEIRDPLGVYGSTAGDTLNGGSGADRLFGLAGNDWLAGNAGADILAGGAGNDTLTGGAGVDHFRFESGTGSDSVTDFQHGPAGDFVDLVGTGITTFAQVQAAMTQQGGNVVLDFGGGNQVQFMNTLLSDFDPTRFTYG